MTACKSHWMKVLQLFQRMKRLKLTPVAPELMGGCFGLTRQLSDKKMPRNSMQVYFEDFRIIGYEWGLDGYGLVFKYVSIDLKMIYNCIQLQLIHSIYY